MGGCHNLLFPYYMGVPVQTTDRYDPGHQFISFSLSKSANTAFHFFITPQPFYPPSCLRTVWCSFLRPYFLSQPTPSYLFHFPLLQGHTCCQLVISIVNGSAKGICRRAWLIRSHRIILSTWNQLFREASWRCNVLLQSHEYLRGECPTLWWMGMFSP